MDAKRPSLPEMKLPPLPAPGQGQHFYLFKHGKMMHFSCCSTTNNTNETIIFSFSYLPAYLSLQVCFLPPCRFLPKLLRVQWASDSLAHHWWATVVSPVTVFFLQLVEMCQINNPFSTGAPPYPPNQYSGGGGGGGRGNYDNFRGQGGYLGKPRNIR